MKALLLLIISMSAVISPIKAALIPLPREVKVSGGMIHLDGRTSVAAGKENLGAAAALVAGLQKATGFAHQVKDLERVRRMGIKRAIKLLTAEGAEATKLKPQGYRLEITSEQITVTGADPAGVMNGVQTLVQLLPVRKKPQGYTAVPCQVVTDWPEQERRVFFLDVASHLFPTEDLKKLVDLLALHKLNEFHLLLNNDQGWRMESQVYPKLHEIGSQRASTPLPGDPTSSDGQEYGGYYTQENLKDLAAYATSRQVKLVPAFSFFHGASAMVAAYPELGEPGVKVQTTWEESKVGLKPGQKTRNFLKPLLEEIAEIFPSDVIRLNALPAKQMEAVHLRRLLVPQKRKIIDGSKIEAVDLSVYGAPEEAELLLDPRRRAKTGLLTARKIFQGKPGAEARVETPLITEYAKLEYMLLPRIGAFAEAAWLPKEKRKYEDFRIRAEKMVTRYRILGLSSADFYEVPQAITLGGVTVTSSIKGRENHWPELVFDGRKETFFWTEEGLKKGDHLTLEFPWVITGDLEIATGRQGDTDSTVLQNGVLEISGDGKDWDAVVEFFGGLATTTLKPGTRFVRCRVTGAQEEPLVIHEVRLSESLLMPIHEETLTFSIKHDDETVEIPLTFRADFSKAPGARAEVGAMRRTFFGTWIRMANTLGVQKNPGVNKDFEITLEQDPNLTAGNAADRAVTQMAKAMANYGPGTPDWYQKGMISFLRKKFAPASNFALQKAAEPPVREAILTGEPAAAEFLSWMEGQFTHAFTLMSQDCVAGRYREENWKKLTGQTLEELITSFLAGKSR